MRTVLIILLALVPVAALAHGGENHGTLSWTWDPFIVVPLLVSLLLYSRGVAMIWRRAGRGRGIKGWQVLCFGAGWLTLFGALCSPLHWLGEHLFSAHMTEHEILMAVAAPLLAAARPIGAFLRALPKSWRAALTRSAHATTVRGAWSVAVDPTVATIVHGIALWAWHAPVLFDATVTNELLHRLQHMSFLFSALLFWWALFRRPRRDLGLGAMHVFATMLHMSLLGALLALSPTLLYVTQTEFAPEFGLTPLEDQQLGGLIMWVPAGTLYAAAALAMLGLWMTMPRGRARKPAWN
jgi:putative membrane protein